MASRRFHEFDEEIPAQVRISNQFDARLNPLLHPSQRLVIGHAAGKRETGRLDAAVEAVREILSMDPAFTLQRFALSQPYRDPAALELLLSPLRRAGLRDGGDPVPATIFVLPPHDASRRRIAPRPRR